MLPANTAYRVKTLLIGGSLAVLVSSVAVCNQQRLAPPPVGYPRIKLTVLDHPYLEVINIQFSRSRLESYLDWEGDGIVDELQLQWAGHPSTAWVDGVVRLPEKKFVRHKPSKMPPECHARYQQVRARAKKIWDLDSRRLGDYRPKPLPSDFPTFEQFMVEWDKKRAAVPAEADSATEKKGE